MLSEQEVNELFDRELEMVLPLDLKYPVSRDDVVTAMSEISKVEFVSVREAAEAEGIDIPDGEEDPKYDAIPANHYKDRWVSKKAGLENIFGEREADIAWAVSEVYDKSIPSDSQVGRGVSRYIISKKEDAKEERHTSG